MILEAINDLNNKQKIKIVNEDGEYLRDEKGRIIRRSLHEDAVLFLSGESGALDEICSSCNLNANAIKTAFKQLGPEQLKKQFLHTMKMRKAQEI